MTQNPRHWPDATSLRRRAEKQLLEQPVTFPEPLTEAESQRLIHELQVRQIELELQNAELRQTCTQLEQSLEKYTGLYDFAPAGCFVLDHDGTILEANLTGAALFGVERSRLLRRQFGIFVSAETQPAFNAFLETVLQGAPKATCEITLQGTPPRDLHLEGVILESGAGRQCRIAMMDFSAIRQAEETLQVYQQIVDSSPDALSLVGTDYHYKIINDTYLHHTGWSRGQIVGHPVAAVMGSAVFDNIIKSYLDRCLAGDTVNYSKWFDFPVQGHRYMDVTYIPCRDRNGAIIGAMVVSRDTTERQQMEEAIVKMNQYLEQHVAERTVELARTAALLEQETHTRRDREAQLIQARKLEAIGRITGGIAHDFNNLLTVIKGNLEILREQGEKEIDPERALLIEDALSATRQSIELTAGLLAFSRQQPLRLQRTRIHRILRGLERLLDRMLEPATRLHVAIDPTVPDVMTDPGHLQAALMNLMLNAQDAMPKGGTLDVHAAAVDVPGEAVALDTGLAPGGYVAVTVADSGIGMDADTLARACEPFFTTKPFGKGTGLGLAIVYGFAAQSNGGIAIESQPGQGTTVRLFLPALEPSSECLARETQAPPLPVLAEGTETILVVEDESRVRRLACRYLRDIGYPVLEAADAEEAIAILETEPDIQIVFSDIIMPGDRNGFDLADWVAVHRPAVKCLLTTGHHQRACATPASHLHYHPVLIKPYYKEQLAHRIRQQLDEKSSSA